MKKVLSFVLAFCMIIPCMFMLSACADDHTHTFAETWTFNDTHHWHASTCEHSDEKSAYAEHVDEDLNDICDVCRHGVVATINELEYTSLQTAINAVSAEQTIVLFDDIDLETAIEITKPVIIDLNGKTLSVSQDTEGNGVFWVKEGGDLTINGEGVVNGVGDNIYNIAIYVNGGELTINGGLYTNTGLTVNPEDQDNQHYDLIYVKGGSVEINGGTFEGFTPDWLLNLRDDMRHCSSITVKGGTFHGFNPANNATEGLNTNYVALGYTVVQDGDCYIVESDGLTYASAHTITDLKDALSSEVDVIVLQADLDLKEVNENKKLIINEGKHVIDLNGYKIKGVDDGSANWHAMDVRGATTEITIKDSSTEKTGTIEGRCYGIQVSRGAKLTIDGGNFVCTTNGTYNQSVVVYGGTLVVNGGVFTTKVYETIFGQNYTWDEVAYANSITINGGEFNYIGETDPDYGLFYFAGDNQTVVINGGTFNNNEIAYVVSAENTVTFTNNAGISEELIDVWEAE